MHGLARRAGYAEPEVLQGNVRRARNYGEQKRFLAILSMSKE